jgi:uncharacterized membrane protein
MKRLASFEKWLLGFFIFIGAMICARIVYSGSMLFVFLSWNVFLAWIPFWISRYLGKPGFTDNLTHNVLFGCWLLFFPNALYITTDLIHLEMDSNVPKWFDAILLFTSSAVGLLMALVSLLRVEHFLDRRFGKKIMPVIMLLILFMGSFGVYLGRFLRYNSWDVVSKPWDLMSTVFQQFLFPFDHLRAWGITGLLTILFYLLYQSAKKLPG